MPKLLFLVHGMGVHGSDWSSPVRAKLVEAAGRYAAFQKGPPLDQRVEIVPVTYDGVFTGMLQQWQGSSDALAAFAHEHAIPVPTLLTWLNTAPDTEQAFFWSHVVDVLLYRFNSMATRQARLLLMSTIAARLVTAMEGGEAVEASVLAHSLGTSVAHDALALLGSAPQDGSRAFLAGNFRFANYFAVANVSKVLETAPAVYASVVHPDTAAPSAAYLTRYYNFRHLLDPFPAVGPFLPPGWGDDYRPVEGLDHIRDFNVHDLEHYLDAPAVHIPIINGILGPVITQQERRDAVERYAAEPGPPCADRVRAFVAAGRELIALVKDSGEPERLLMAGCRFLAAAREARDECR